MATIKVKTDLNSRNYKRGIKEMQKKNKTFGKGLSKVKGAMKAAFAVSAILVAIGALIRFGASLFNAGSKLSDLSAQTGVAIGTLNRFNDAARNAGSSADKMAKALVSLKDAQGEVLTGDMLMTEAFKNLGLSIDEVAEANTAELFLKVSEALTETGNSSVALSAAFDVLGKRNAMELLEAMNELAGGIDKVKAAKAAMSDESAQILDISADLYAQEIQGIQNAMSGFLAKIIGKGKNVKAELENRKQRAADMEELEAQSRLADLAELKKKAEADRLASVKKIADAEKKIAEQRAKDIKNIQESVTIKVDTNSIRRLGGFAGSRVSDQLKFARKTAETSAQIEDYTSSLPQIEKNTEKQGLT